MSELICPVAGFDVFLVYRGIDEDEIEVIIGEGIEEFERLMVSRDPAVRPRREELRTHLEGYVFSSQVELRLWLWRAGVPDGFIERFVDLIWNWRLLKYDRRTHHLSIPEVQRHPLEPLTSPVNLPFRAPRPEDTGSRDIFDPLQDKKNRDFWSPT